MIQSFAEFKFYQSFRVPIDHGDEIRFSAEKENLFGESAYISDATLIDISFGGIGFKSTQKMKEGELIAFSIQFKKLRFDVTGKIVRVFGDTQDPTGLVYGVELDDEDNINMRRFIEQYIMNMSTERMRSTLTELSLRNRYQNVTDGFEMVSLFLSVFKDINLFSERPDFVESLLSEVSRIFEAQRASIFLINPETNELEAVAAIDEEKEQLRFDYRKGIAGTVFTTGITLNIDAHDKKSRFYSHIDDKTGFKTKSVLCSPIRNSEDKVIGVLQILNKISEERFTIDDERMMRVMSLVFSSIYHTYNPISEKSLIRRFSKPFDREFAMIGQSRFMTDLRKAMVQLKDLDIPVLIEGEAGTGKKLLARILHNEGKRALEEYTVINCAEHDSEKLSLLFFGDENIKSKFEECYGGTVVLDEVQTMPMALQAKLVEMMLSGKITENIPFKTRVIAVTSKDLEEEVERGHFHKALYRMLEKACVKMQPVRERREDIPMMVEYFTAKECRESGLLNKEYSEKVMDYLMSLDWRGNVIELKSSIEKIVLYHPKENIITKIDNAALPVTRTQSGVLGSLANIELATDSQVALKDRVAMVEREIILAEIRRAGGNKSQAARNMGISREALRKKLLISDDIMDRNNVNTDESLNNEAA